MCHRRWGKGDESQLALQRGLSSLTGRIPFTQDRRWRGTSALVYGPPWDFLRSATLTSRFVHFLHRTGFSGSEIDLEHGAGLVNGLNPWPKKGEMVKETFWSSKREFWEAVSRCAMPVSFLVHVSRGTEVLFGQRCPGCTLSHFPNSRRQVGLFDIS